MTNIFDWRNVLGGHAAALFDELQATTKLRHATERHRRPHRAARTYVLSHVEGLQRCAPERPPRALS